MEAIARNAEFAIQDMEARAAELAGEGGELDALPKEEMERIRIRMEEQLGELEEKLRALDAGPGPFDGLIRRSITHDDGRFRLQLFFTGKDPAEAEAMTSRVLASLPKGSGLPSSPPRRSVIGSEATCWPGRRGAAS